MSYEYTSEFQLHLKYLVDMVIKESSGTPYWIRNEHFDNADWLDTIGPTAAGSEWVTCMNCGQKVDMKETEVKNTGYVEYLDTVTKTPCCKHLIDPKLCPAVCVGCRRLACFFTPHKNDTGFEYVPGRSYHLDRCSNCDGRMEMSSTILEQVVHNKLNNINE